MNRKKLVSFGLILVLVATMLLVGCGGQGGNAAEVTSDDPIILKLGHTGIVDHYYHMGSEKFAELVKEKTDGRVIVEVYPSDQLGSQRASVEGAQIGTQDMVLTSSMVLSNFNPIIGVYDLPFLFPNREVAFAAMDGDVAKQVEEVFLDEGLVFLGWWENGFRHITNNTRPINSPEDLRGLKIRVPESPVFIDTFTALGAAPTPISFGELFSALQLRTVDGQENPAGHVITQRFFEVQDHFALTSHFYTPEPLVMSKIVYDRLPEDIQQALHEAGVEAGEYARQLSIDFEQDYLAEIEKVGMTITYPDLAPFQKAVESVYEKYDAEYGDLIRQIQTLY